MRKMTVIIAIMAGFTAVWGMLLFDQPVTVTQPDGTKLELFASGDEFYNYLHDENDYTILQDENTGYYVYAENIRGELASGRYRVDHYNPQQLGITPGIRISKQEYLERKARFDVPERYASRAPNEGTLNNLVVYIRFSDQTEFPEPRSTFDPLFNADDNETPSMFSYYDEVSYGALQISSTHYPITGMETNLSYQSDQPRDYYSPYNSVTNPIGYDGWEERAWREQSLLADAIEFIADEVPDTLDIDGDDDGQVDNVCFVIRGGNDDWAELLWAHRWSLYMVDAFINGYQVMDFTFQPRTQVEVTTLNHEMFHALGAPDLYHYNSSVYAPASSWDIMEGGSGHMSAYMKYRYGGWIEELPVISESGTYSLSPLNESGNNVFRINSPNSYNEYFVLEYRKRVPGTYEMNLPSEGLLIWRVDNNLSGSGNADGPPDELYVYRPGGTSTTNGSPSNATFNEAYGRTEFSDTTNPSDWLQNGGLGGIFIHQIGNAEDQITFTLNPSEGFIAGTITSNLPEADYSLATVEIGNLEMTVDPSGGFSGMYYAGEYSVTAYMPGHGSATQQVTIEAGLVTEVDFDLNWLIPAENLAYTLEEGQFEMSWDFYNYDDPEFLNFNVWVKLGTNPNFMQITSTDEAVYNSTLSPVFDYHFYITAEYANGLSSPSDTLDVVLTTDSDEEEITVPAVYINNYPNPFNPQTTIAYKLPEDVTNLQLTIYNTKGQAVREFNLNQNQGNITWNGDTKSGTPAASGLYFAIIKADNVSISKKMLMMK